MRVGDSVDIAWIGQIPGLVTEADLNTPSPSSAPIPGLVTEGDFYNAPSTSAWTPPPGTIFTGSQLTTPSASTWTPPAGTVFNQAQLFTPTAPAAPAPITYKPMAPVAPRPAAAPRMPSGKAAARMPMMPQAQQRQPGVAVASAGLPDWAIYTMIGGGFLAVGIIIIALIPNS